MVLITSLLIYFFVAYKLEKLTPYNQHGAHHPCMGFVLEGIVPLSPLNKRQNSENGAICQTNWPDMQINVV